jgi:hypothetical protein
MAVPLARLFRAQVQFFSEEKQTFRDCAWRSAGALEVSY